MAEDVKIWYDKEADYLQVLFERKAGYFRETDNDSMMEKVDTDGNIVGFSIMKISSLSKQAPLSFSLKNRLSR